MERSPTKKDSLAPIPNAEIILLIVSLPYMLHHRGVLTLEKAARLDKVIYIHVQLLVNMFPCKNKGANLLNITSVSEKSKLEDITLNRLFLFLLNNRREMTQ